MGLVPSLKRAVTVTQWTRNHTSLQFVHDECLPHVVRRTRTHLGSNHTPELSQPYNGISISADAESSSAWFTAGSHSVDEFRYLCPMGGCVTQAELAQRPNCAWAVSPAHAVVVNPALVGYDVVQDLQGAFQAAAATSAFQALFFKTVSGDVVNTGDLVFKGSTCVTLTLNLPPPALLVGGAALPSLFSQTALPRALGQVAEADYIATRSLTRASKAPSRNSPRGRRCARLRGWAGVFMLYTGQVLAGKCRIRHADVPGRHVHGAP